MIKTKVTQPIAIATIASIIAIASFPSIIFSALPTAKIVAQEVEPVKKSPDQVIRWNAIALLITDFGATKQLYFLFTLQRY
jgi:hypothetical protein